MSELWFKNEKVLTLKDIEGVPGRIEKIDSPELLPFVLRDNCNNESFIKWLRKRNIPKEREGYKEVIEEFSDNWLYQKNYASLSDQYWIKRRTEKWNTVNFFKIRYSTEIGDMFFTPWDIDTTKHNNNTPDMTTGGVLKKRWCQNSDRTSFLIKAGSKETRQDPLSEVLVSVLCERIGIIKSAGYDLHIEGNLMCSKTQNFINEETELITASDFYYKEEKQAGDTVYDHLIKMCEKNRIPKAKEFIDAMIFIDCITANEDRNLNNIGFIKKSGTDEFIGPAPLYDCGNAYWSTKNVNDAVKSKLFGDVEPYIVKNQKKICDISFLETDESYIHLIETYPGITDEKKENLIKAIKRRNTKLCMEVKNINNVER